MLVQLAAYVPSITVLCDDSTPPLPCAIAVSQSAIWPAPPSGRSCRTASISRNDPHMRRDGVREATTIGVDRQTAPGSK